MQGRTLKCILSTYYTIYHKVKWPFAIEWKVKREVMPIPPTFCFRHSNYTSTIVTMATIKKDLKICTEFKVQLFMHKHKSPDHYERSPHYYIINWQKDMVRAALLSSSILPFKSAKFNLKKRKAHINPSYHVKKNSYLCVNSIEESGLTIKHLWYVVTP